MNLYNPFGVAKSSRTFASQGALTRPWADGFNPFGVANGCFMAAFGYPTAHFIRRNSWFPLFPPKNAGRFSPSAASSPRVKRCPLSRRRSQTARPRLPAPAGPGRAFGFRRVAIANPRRVDGDRFGGANDRDICQANEHPSLFDGRPTPDHLLNATFFLQWLGCPAADADFLERSRYLRATSTTTLFLVAPTEIRSNACPTQLSPAQGASPQVD